MAIRIRASHPPDEHLVESSNSTANLAPSEPIAAQLGANLADLEPLATMERRIKELRRRTQLLQEEERLLDEQAAIYERMHSDDLDRYPEEVRIHVSRRAAPQGRSKRPREPDSDEDDVEEEESSSSNPTSVLQSRETSSAPSQRKRTTRRPKVVEPDPYYRKSQRELDEFVQVCERAFDHDLQAFPKRRDKITWAAM